MSLQPRVVVVHRRSEYEQLLRRHGTRQAAAFFLDRRGRAIETLEQQHDLLHRARREVSAAIPSDCRRAEIERGDLPRFSFAPEDLIVAVGQDGLVANTAKYIRDQPVVGVNPDPDVNPGVLVPHSPANAARIIATALTGDRPVQRRAMVVASTDDGQTLFALNEVYFGHRSHQSARYHIVLSSGERERQSSSGVLVGTGTGATGWLRSTWQERRSALELPRPEDGDLCWFVREAWPSIATGTNHTEGRIRSGAVLKLTSESDELVCFGDGIESDFLPITWGQTVTIAAADRTLHLVGP